MVNNVVLIGRLGKDPEMQFTPTGNPVVTLSIATERRHKDSAGATVKSVEWHRVTAWGVLAETANAYLVKGRLVYVQGYLKTTHWEEDGKHMQRTEIVAETIRYLERKQYEPYMPVEDLPSDLGQQVEEQPVQTPKRNGRKKHPVAQA